MFDQILTACFFWVCELNNPGLNSQDCRVLPSDISLANVILTDSQRNRVCVCIG